MRSPHHLGGERVLGVAVSLAAPDSTSSSFPDDPRRTRVGRVLSGRGVYRATTDPSERAVSAPGSGRG